MKKLGFNALLGVGQGSVNETYLVTLEWNGKKNVEFIIWRKIAWQRSTSWFVSRESAKLVKVTYLLNA